MRLRIDAAEVADALEAATAYDAVSLDSPAYGSQADEPGPRLPTPSAPRKSATSWSSMGSRSSPRCGRCRRASESILRLRFREDMTQAEIAARLGMSQMHVSRLLRQALARLREVARVRDTASRPPARPYHGGMTARPPPVCALERGRTRRSKPPAQSGAKNDGKADSRRSPSAGPAVARARTAGC